MSEVGAARAAKAVVFAALLFLCAIASGGCANSPGHVRTADLRCEYLHNPVGLDESSPRLMWIVQADRRAEHQSAYRVLVASSPRLLQDDRADLWDTGKVAASEAPAIAYSGTALRSRQQCFWKVMAWDRDGAPGPWSQTNSWEMGLLDRGDWKAQWIDACPPPSPAIIQRAAYYTPADSIKKDVTKSVVATIQKGEPIIAANDALGGDPAPNQVKRLAIDYRLGAKSLHADVAENAVAMLAPAPMPCLRKTFAVAKPIVRARLYVTALGLYEVFLNGHRIGDQRLAPGWTDYRIRVPYQVYNVSDFLNQGDNTLGAFVAPGWYSGRAGNFHLRAFYGKSPAFLAQLEITYPDGSGQRIITDNSWQRHDGPILAADIMDGETYDARAEVSDWFRPRHSDSGWSAVKLRKDSPALIATVDQPVRELQKLSARSLTQPRKGSWTFDLGQNMVGVVCLRVREKAGTVITIRHAEILNPDGTIYTANLRGAAATDTFICGGTGIEIWQPRFTYHGFRYVELTGLSHNPGQGAVTGIVLGSDVPSAGEFSCSDGHINQLESNIRWGMRGNYLSIPTDCPQRDERMGWMGDAEVFAPTAAFNANIAAFMTKWMIDVADAQRPDGAFPDVAPAMSGQSYGTPAWADAGDIVPWTIYQMYGDTRILRRHIDSMMRWVDWCQAHSKNLIRDHDLGGDYGDWLSINADTPDDLIGTAYFAHSAQIVADSLHALGRDADAVRYRQLFDQVRKAFIARYLKTDRDIAKCTQTACVLALQFGLVPDSSRDAVANRLISDIKSRGGHLSTGFLGASQILPALTDTGHPHAAYRLLMQDTYPSWLYPVEHGATTIWERWNGWTPEHGPEDPGMNSFNHYAYGSCGQWLFTNIAGIAPDPASPGFAHFFIHPRINGPITNCHATYNSMCGPIAVDWTVARNRLTLNVTIPANTTATVYIPASDAQQVHESGHALDVAEGIRVLPAQPNVVVLTVGSGSYHFTSRLPPTP